MITVAIIGAGAMAKTLATRAKELHIRTICFAWDKGAIAKDSVDEFQNVDIFDTETIINICKEKNVQGVLATTELTVKIASIVAKFRNFPVAQVLLMSVLIPCPGRKVRRLHKLKKKLMQDTVLLYP